MQDLAKEVLSISRAGALVQRIDAVESMSRVDTLVLEPDAGGR